MFRFLHSSDLHLGKPFGRFPEDVRARLRQARAEALPRLADLARAHGATHVLLAGDTFDQTTPAPTTVRHALNAMAGAEGVEWVLLPGNHDHANATELWRQVRRDAPANVTALLDPAPHALPGAVILPAPPAERHPGRDLTDWFDSADTGEALRIGLAHGSVTDFDSSEEGGSAVIAPDRAARAGLAWLALGDWHGQRQIGPRCWYSGTPEADSFKHATPPSALLVELDGPGAPPRVTALPTGALHWSRLRLELDAQDDPLAAHATVLPELADRARTLLDLRISGQLRPAARADLDHAIARVAPDFLWHRADSDALALVQDGTDLDLIDHHGALRATAETLVAEAEDPALDPEIRATARAALQQLFTYALEDRA
ncbi:DNA repair exonuclease [Rhodobacteraceae bacterium 2376]|uniref:DNA repair exonuclease n=1 Tax=Rhabdonatronobacter sediminivivens TaxID=2743469 RepID=A0A7Z0I1N6_9RHOB|nr:DNA repair exonuclease [Rhabdonatronobacter sediminivivens]NYS26304.1 DNA repair exonuclease [Rhabdonatronobacter sediminivivens]